MDRRAFSLFAGIFLGYTMVYAFKFLNSNVLWILFYQH